VLEERMVERSSNCDVAAKIGFGEIGLSNQKELVCIFP
jgi:hypothetical protein